MGLIVIQPTKDRRLIGYCGLCEVELPATGQVVPYPYYSNRDMLAHMASAEHKANVEIERAAQEAKRQRLAIFYDPEAPGSDPEIAAHLKEVGKRMLAEGRWEVKKNERAGFS